MVRLTAEAKAALVQQVLNRGNETVVSIAKRNNVGYSSLQKWARQFRDFGECVEKRQTIDVDRSLSPTERFNHLVAVHGLDELSLGKYCRKHGLYSHELKHWRDSLMTQDKTQDHLSALRELKRENKQLQRELRRKEKALAEASALLIMKKKADLIWGANEDDSCQ